MNNRPRAKRKMSEIRLEQFLDSIKDEIDTLSQIANEKQRLEAANDLIEYIKLHFEL